MRSRITFTAAIEECEQGLPLGWRIEILIERGVSIVQLYDPAGGELHQFVPGEDDIVDTLDALSRALAEAVKRGPIASPPSESQGY